MTAHRLTVLLALLLLCSCATPAESTGYVAAGVAGLAAVFDQLTSHGVISPVQHLQVEHSLDAISQTIKAAADAAGAAQQVAASVKAGTLTPAETTGLVTTTVAAAGVALNAWRNGTRKTALSDVKAV